MTKKIVLSLLFLLLVVRPSYAQDLMYKQNTAVSRTGTDSPRPEFKKPISTTLPIKQELMIQNRASGSAKMQEFKAKISEIQDARKKQIVEKIGTNITSLNTRSTNKMSEALTKMITILNNIKSKEATIAASGADTAALNTAITNAESAITAAQTAVAAQTQKEYTATLTSSATASGALKNPISAMFLQFKSDITTAFKAVMNAKEAMVKVIVELNKITGEKPATPAADLRT